MLTLERLLRRYFYRRRPAIRAALTALPLLFLLPVVLGWRESPSLTRFENFLYDLRVRLTMPSIGARAIVVDADASSKRYYFIVGARDDGETLTGILDEPSRLQPSWSRAFEGAMLLLIAFVVGFVLPGLIPAAALLGVMLLGGAIVAFNLMAWTRWGIALPLATPLTGLFATAAILLHYIYFFEGRRRRRLAQVFSPYVPPAVVQQLDGTDAEISLEGESREMSVLFSDVRGFTTLSEGLNPRELTRLMNELLTPLTDVIQERRGTIDKYMGDAIMAFWGAPLTDPEHAHHAVLAALEMVECTRRIRAEFVSRGWPEVHIGVGINSGLMNVGNMGSRFRMAYTVLGDAVNLGSRLEGLTKQYGVEIVVSGATARLCPGIAFRELDLVRVRGRSEPVAIYQPLGLAHTLQSAHVTRLERFSEMLTLYRSRHFQRAQELLAALAAEREEPLIALYRQRVAHFLAEPPPGTWDGVFAHETK